MLFSFTTCVHVHHISLPPTLHTAVLYMSLCKPKIPSNRCLVSAALQNQCSGNKFLNEALVKRLSLNLAGPRSPSCGVPLGAIVLF